MYPKKLIFILLSCMLLLTGCQHSTFSEEDAFQYVEDIVNDHEITVNFSYKDRELQDMDLYTFGIHFESEWGSEMIPGIWYNPAGGKLGFKIITNGNEWEIKDLYSNTKGARFSPENLKPTQGTIDEKHLLEIYENANWKLKPLKDNYHLWIEDFLLNSNPSEDLLARKPYALFQIIDLNSDTKFTVGITNIHAETYSTPKSVL